MWANRYATVYYNNGYIYYMYGAEAEYEAYGVNQCCATGWYYKFSWG
jgi:hypothetical protein